LHFGRIRIDAVPDKLGEAKNRLTHLGDAVNVVLRYFDD
jgi:hypothetical protein